MNGACPRTLSRVGRALLFLALPLVVGCEFDPSEHVHSPTRPDCITQDGIVWVALKCSGDNDEWFYVPQEAAIASRSIDVPDGYSFAVLVNGKAWKITKKGDGYSFDGFQDADLSASPGLVVIAVVLGIGVVVCVFVAAGFYEKTVEQAKEFDAVKEENKSLKEIDRRRQAEAVQLCQAVAQEEKEAVRRVAAEARKVAAERQAVQAERDELEKQRRAMVAAARDRQPVKHEPANDEDRRQFGRVVRDRLLGGKETNREISVEYAFDPEMTGALVFRWQLVQDRPYPPSLTVLRDQAVIRTASSVFNGEFGYWLVKADKRYRFIFQLHDGGRRLPDPLVVELTMPSLAAWNRRGIPKPPPAKLSKEERERLGAEWEAREKQRAAESEKDPGKLKKMFAKIEQERMEKFGEAE